MGSEDETSTFCGQNKVYALKLSEGYRIVNTHEDNRIANRLICRVKTFSFTKFHPIQGPKATQNRRLLNEVFRGNISRN